MPRSKSGRGPRSLTLRELEALTGAGAAVLLALDGTRVARDEASLLQRRPRRRSHLDQRAGQAVANGARLARQAAATDVDRDVQLVALTGDVQRLLHDHPQDFATEVVVDRPLVDDDLTRARTNP